MSPRNVWPVSVSGAQNIQHAVRHTELSPTQPWRTFLGNHAPDIAAMDLFVAPTIGFNLLYGFIVVRLARRRKGGCAAG
jgi:hypothetical protein